MHKEDYNFKQIDKNYDFKIITFPLYHTNLRINRLFTRNIKFKISKL